MAPSLWPLAFSQALGHGPKAMSSSPRPWSGSPADSERNWVMTPSPRQCPQAPGHGRGHGPWPWPGPQAYGQRRVSMGIGYRVWGVGYWVVGIGYRVVGIFIFSNTFDARWVGGFWIIGYVGILMFSVLGIRVLGYWVSGSWHFHSFQHARRQMGRRITITMY